VHKVVLDTNVLISAIAFEGKPREVFNRILKGQIQLAISKDILDEIEGVLSGKKFQYPKEVIHSIRNALEGLAEFVTPQKEVKRIKKDPDDNRILECALEAKAHLIISGDNHLLELKQYINVRIITPSDYLKEY
jgi:putative PIN family toxin of toxin-antitoxin system